MKTHKLKTVEDIVQVVDQGNLNEFIKSFTTWLKIQAGLKAAKGKSKGVKLAKDQFEWLDDPKHGYGAVIPAERPQGVSKKEVTSLLEQFVGRGETRGVSVIDQNDRPDYESCDNPKCPGHVMPEGVILLIEQSTAMAVKAFEDEGNEDGKHFARQMFRLVHAWRSHLADDTLCTGGPDAHAEDFETLLDLAEEAEDTNSRGVKQQRRKNNG